MQVVVLGAGLVGRPIALNLALEKNLAVTAVDVNPESLRKFPAQSNIKTITADLKKASEIHRIIDSADLVINALPGFMGFDALQEIISAGKDVVDIAFSERNALELDSLAREKGVTAIVDCGVAPGMSNLLVGHAHAMLDSTEDVEILVGGLPRVRTLPYEYKAVFSPIDVIEEYTRPARLIENGQMVVKPALSELELVQFPEVGTLEAFNSDGLRSLLYTIPAKNMREKTLRYPGHAEKIKLLRDTGFFKQQPVMVNGSSIRPIDLTAKLLFPIWALNENEEDFTIMRITVEGVKKGVPARYRWDLFDSYDRETGIHSMARTTGYTAVVTALIVLEGRFNRAGVFPLEELGKQPELVSMILKGLAARGVHYRFSEE